MNTVRNCMWGTLAAALMILVAPAALAASVPPTVGYQGRLYDQNGNPVSGTMSVTFSLYTSATGGTAVWTETESVSFANGYFAVQLGSVTAFGTTAFDGTVRYLGVKVGTDAEMTPRSTVASVPYALAAAPFGTNASPAATGASGAQCTLGEVILTAGMTANGATLPADGRLLPISGNAALYSLLGTRYGGDGVTTFALPDLRSAAPNGLTYGVCATSGVFP